jgi:putative ATP-dependent endonuclease of the OLD family
MRIEHIEIQNFRNFHHLSLTIGEHAVIVGENKIGKSNLIYALRLVLDPRLSDSDRQLRLDDFWDGLERPLKPEDFIRISVDLTGFEDNESQMAVLAEHLIQAEPMISRLTYLFRPLPSLKKPPRKEADYEFIVFGGDRPENRIGYETRQWMPLALLPALRNAEDDLANWRQSPLAPLLRAVSANLDRDKLEKVAKKVTRATSAVAKLREIDVLSKQIQDSLQNTVGEKHAVKTTLGFSPTDPDRLLRSLRLFIDNGLRNISDASLGSANLIYLTLMELELDRQISAGERSHTFVAIEEPEAHLHPHVQRLVFRDFLAARMGDRSDGNLSKSQTVLLTTHSPHIVSVAPLKSIVVLRKSRDGADTVGVSTANLDLEDATINDLERYLDVKRGELAFAKGVLLVEGPAEEFVLPVLGGLLGYDFDQLGITVCSVDGTNFAPYVQLLGKHGLELPHAILTDMDPQGRRNTLGVPRVRRLLAAIDAAPETAKIDRDETVRKAARHGIFLNNYTFEVDLFRCGRYEVMCDTLIALTTNHRARDRAMQWKDRPASLEPEQFLKDIEEIGKGRFAQRLATLLTGRACPPYIRKAINYVARRIM